MSQARAYARRHVIANWKGIAFHCFDLNRHLTGLQGQNGSGKTTVMSAYVTAILPNQRLLNFPNLTGDGVASKGDTGLWGRLGEDGVTYSFLEWMTPAGKSIWAGVAMTRGSMSTIDMKLLTIEGMPEGTDPYDAFLDRSQDQLSVPSLMRLREQLTCLGAKVITHRTLAEYMKALYEHGITPMPMATYDEQERFYRVLATSMAGSSLGSLVKSGLRDYLLTDDESLLQRVSKMRDSLEHCRLTKCELERTQSAHMEISSLHDSSWKMSSHAYFGAIGRFENSMEGWKVQVKTTREKRAEHKSKTETIEDLKKQLAELDEKIIDLERDLAEKRKNEADKTSARRIRIKLDAVQQSCTQAEQAYEAAKHQLKESSQAESKAMTQDDTARAVYAGIVEQIGDMEKAVEELIRKVTSLHVARKKLEAAQQALPGQHVSQGNAGEISKSLEVTYVALTQQHATLTSQHDSFAENKQKFDRILCEIRKVSMSDRGAEVLPQDAYRYGVLLGNDLRSHLASAGVVDDLTKKLVRSKHLAQSQDRVRKQAGRLGIESSQALKDAIASSYASIARLEERILGCRLERDEKQQQVVDISKGLPAQKDLCHRYKQAAESRAQLGKIDAVIGAISDMHAMEIALEAVRQKTGILERRRDKLEQERNQTLDGIKSLKGQAGTADRRMAAIAEGVEGKLLVLDSRFDDITLEQAAATQAIMGPWADAIVVESPELSAKMASNIADRPDTLLFVSEKALMGYGASYTVGDSEMVTENNNGLLEGFEGVRLTRRPTRPVLGRRARENEIVFLETELKKQSALHSDLNQEHLMLAGIGKIGLQLMAFGESVWIPDPLPGFLIANARAQSLEAMTSKISAELNQLALDLNNATQVKIKYSELDVNKELIDLPDHSDEANRLEAELALARKSQEWLHRHETAVKGILDELVMLSKVPDESVQAGLAAQLSELDGKRQALNVQRDALTHLMAVINDFQYANEERVYNEKTSLSKDLQRQKEEAGLHQEDTLRHFGMCRLQSNQLREDFTDVESSFKAFVIERDRLARDLTATGGVGTQEECDLARTAAKEALTVREQAGEDWQHKDKRQSHLSTMLGVFQEELKKVNEETEARLAGVWKERNAKADLDQIVVGLGLEGKINSATNRQRFMTGNHIAAFQESMAQSATLIERLRSHPNVQAEVSAIAQFSEAADERRAIQTLKVWERINRHIEERIPRNVATSDDVSVAIEQMLQKMQELRRALNLQEDQMRQRASGVAGGIKARLVNASKLVNRLNKELEQVSFGSIRGVRIAKDEPLHMINMLKALEDTSNMSLFDTEIPLDETLARMYERIGGGRIVGSRLLDYRNYISLRLEVKRINGKWDVTEGVSTGEAIGVGAAVLIMVLRTWNDEATRISGARGHSMQQIFLDEANRLDPESLNMLTEFCHRMDVQALVAAPGLERPRRSTVFMLERNMVNNREHVTIRGQRMLM